MNPNEYFAKLTEARHEEQMAYDWQEHARYYVRLGRLVSAENAEILATAWAQNAADSYAEAAAMRVGS